MNTSNTKCLVCGGHTTKLFGWTSGEIRHKFQKKVVAPFPDEANCPDYTILKCLDCELVFAWPPTPGNNAFYAWITQAPNYYQASRWEWGETLRIMKSIGASSLLEIGCGTGNFLQYVTNNSDIKVTGLDTHKPSITACEERGLTAHCLDLHGFVTTYPERRYDVLCAFHCLEHVSDPSALFHDARQLLAPNGFIIMSVPYSPTSQDVLARDCMNLPPHHLTQWNQRSLNALGKASGLEVDVRTDKGIFGPSIMKSAYWYFLSSLGVKNSFMLANVVRILTHPIRFLKCLTFVAKRETLSGRPAGDIALAVFRR